MTILFVLLTLGMFLFGFFMTFRYGSDSPFWVPLILGAMLVGAFFSEGYNINPYHFLLTFLVLISSRLTALVILRKQAGRRMLAYPRNTSGFVWRLLFTALFFYYAFRIGISIKDRTTFLPEDVLKAGLIYFATLTLLGIYNLLTVFRKGEFFENGITDPDFNFFPWKGFKAYEWVGYKKKNVKRFLLYLEGAQNASQSIDHLSEQDKNILEELLSAKLKKNPESQN